MSAHPFASEGLASLLRRLALPGIAGALIMAVHSLVDAAFIGSFLGLDALAGLSLGMPLAILIGSLTGLIGGGSASAWSRSLGRAADADRTILMAQIFRLSLAASLLLGITGYLFAENFLRLLGAAGDSLASGAEYYRILLGGCFFSIYGVSCNGILRAEGKVASAMRFAMLSVTLNMALDACFLGLLGWGIGSAALSTVLSTAVLALATNRGAFAFKAGEVSRFSRAILNHDKTLSRDILASGFPSLITQSTVFLRQTLLFHAAGHWGDTGDIAFLGAAFRIFTFVMLPVIGLMQSLQPVAGINHGAGEHARVIRAALLWSLAGILLLLPAWCGLQAFPALFLSFFFPPQKVPLEQLGHFRLAMLGLPLLVFPVAVLTTFQAAGKPRIAAWISLGRQLLLFPILLYGLATLSGMRGIYYALAVESILFAGAALLVFLFFRRHYPKAPGRIREKAENPLQHPYKDTALSLAFIPSRSLCRGKNTNGSYRPIQENRNENLPCLRSNPATKRSRTLSFNAATLSFDACGSGRCANRGNQRFAPRRRYAFEHRQCRRRRQKAGPGRIQPAGFGGRPLG